MQKVKKGENVLTIYSDTEKKLKYALNMLKRTCGVRIDGHCAVK